MIPPGEARRVEIEALQASEAKAARILKRLVIAWDADRDGEFDTALKQARRLLGFVKTEAQGGGR